MTTTKTLAVPEQHHAVLERLVDVCRKLGPDPRPMSAEVQRLTEEYGDALRALDGVDLRPVRTWTREEAVQILASVEYASNAHSPTSSYTRALAALMSAPKPDDAEREQRVLSKLAEVERVVTEIHALHDKAIDERDAALARAEKMHRERDVLYTEVQDLYAERSKMVASYERTISEVAARAEKAEARVKELNAEVARLKEQSRCMYAYPRCGKIQPRVPTLEDFQNARECGTRILPPEAPAGEAQKPSGFVKPDTDTQVFFYEQDCYPLSNFSAFRLKWKGVNYDTSEAAYHSEKFTGDGWERFREFIRASPSAHEAFKFAERNKGSVRGDWEQVRVGIMLDILRAKAAQHEYVRRKLLSTGDKELIEDSWRDSFWGWGADRQGQNQLGKLWMHVRDELRASATTTAPRTLRVGDVLRTAEEAASLPVGSEAELEVRWVSETRGPRNSVRQWEHTDGKYVQVQNGIHAAYADILGATITRIGPAHATPATPHLDAAEESYAEFMDAPCAIAEESEACGRFMLSIIAHLRGLK